MLEDYAKALANQSPGRSVELLNARVANGRRTQEHLAKWIHAWSRAVELHAQDIESMLQDQIVPESELGTLSQAWQSVAGVSLEQARASALLARRLVAEVEKPIRKSAATELANADKALVELDRLPGGAAWEERSAPLISQIQEADLSLYSGIRDALTRMQTLQLDHSQSVNSAAERAVQDLLAFDPAEDAQSYVAQVVSGAAPVAPLSADSTRNVSGPGGPGFGGAQPRQTQRKVSRNSLRESASIVSTDSRKKSGTSLRSKVGTIFGRKKKNASKQTDGFREESPAFSRSDSVRTTQSSAVSRDAARATQPPDFGLRAPGNELSQNARILGNSSSNSNTNNSVPTPPPTRRQADASAGPGSVPGLGSSFPGAAIGAGAGAGAGAAAFAISGAGLPKTQVPDQLSDDKRLSDRMDRILPAVPGGRSNTDQYDNATQPLSSGGSSLGAPYSTVQSEASPPSSQGTASGSHTLHQPSPWTNYTNGTAKTTANYSAPTSARAADFTNANPGIFSNRNSTIPSAPLDPAASATSSAYDLPSSSDAPGVADYSGPSSDPAAPTQSIQPSISGNDVGPDLPGNTSSIPRGPSGGRTVRERREIHSALFTGIPNARPESVQYDSRPVTVPETPTKNEDEVEQWYTPAQNFQGEFDPQSPLASRGTQSATARPRGSDALGAAGLPTHQETEDDPDASRMTLANASVTSLGEQNTGPTRSGSVRGRGPLQKNITGDLTTNHPALPSNSGLVATIIETINATVKEGVVETTGISGDINVAFNGSSAPDATLRITGHQQLSSLVPNTTLVHQVSEPGVFSLSGSKLGGHPTTLAKYLSSLTSLLPIVFTSVWRVEERQSRLMLTYSLSDAYPLDQIQLRGLTVAVSVTGGTASSAQSKPVATFSKDKQRVTWRFNEPVVLRRGESQRLLCQFSTDGPAYEVPSGIEARFEIQGAPTSVRVDMLDNGDWSPIPTSSASFVSRYSVVSARPH